MGKNLFLVFIGIFLLFFSVVAIAGSTDFISVTKGSKYKDLVSITQNKDTNAIIVFFESKQLTIKPQWLDKLYSTKTAVNDNALFFTFKQINDNIYKYDINFTNTKGYKSLKLLITSESKTTFDANLEALYTGSFRLDFKDIQKSGLPYSLTKISDTVTLLEILGLEKDKVYYIDPVIDASQPTTGAQPVDVYGAFWFAQQFLSTKKGDITSIRIQMSKVGAPAADLNLAIYNTTAANKPSTIVNSNCILTKPHAGIGTWASITILDWNFPSACPVEADTNYAIVITSIGSAGTGHSYYWPMANVAPLPDTNAMSSHNSGVSWEFPAHGHTWGFYFLEFMEEEIPLDTPDLNVWKIDGYDFNGTLPVFHYNADKNLTITWYAKDDSQRDLNITAWASKVSGTKQTRLFGDINLSTTNGLCNTNDSNAGMVCNYDWNISGVADANYYLDLEVRASLTETTTTSSSKSFKIDNNAPINNSITASTFTGTGRYTSDTTPTLTMASIDVSFMYLSCDNITYGGKLAYAASYSAFNINTGAGCFDGDGNKTVYAIFTDEYDHNATAVNTGLAGNSFVLDRVAPILWGQQPATDYFSNDTTPDLNVSYTDELYYCTIRPFKNGSALADANATLTGTKCTYTTAIALTSGQNILGQFTGYDRAMNVSNDLNTARIYYFYNHLTIKIIDENTGNGVNPDSFTIDGNAWTMLDANGLFNIANLSAITSTTHNIVVTKAGYGTRQWDLNFGQWNGGDYNFAMLDNDFNAKNFDFKYYDSNGISVLNSYKIRVIHIGTGYWSGQRIATAAGLVSFYLDTNSEKYTIQAFNPSGIFTADYNALKLTIKIPLDETNVGLAINPFSVDASGIINYFNGAATTDLNLYIYSNLANPVSFVIGDDNGDYYDRTYYTNYVGNATSTTLQAYLLKTSVSAPIVFITNDKGLNTVASVLIVLYKTIGGVKTVVVSGLTDISGNFPTYVVYGSIYSMEVFYPVGTLVLTTDNFIPTFNPTYLYLSIGSVGTPTPLTNTKVSFFPPMAFIYSGIKDLNQTVTSDLNLIRIRIYVDQNNNGDYNIFYDQNFLNTNNLFNDINLLTITGNPDYNYNFNIRVVVELWTGTTKVLQVFQNYSTGKASGNLDFMNALKNIRGDLGCSLDGICFPTSILSILLTILLTGTVAFGVGRTDSLAMSAIGIMFLGFFVLVGWFDTLLLIPIIIIAAFLIRGEW